MLQRPVLTKEFAILRDPLPEIPAADVLALHALGWILEDEERTSRMVDLTGLTPDILRTQLTSPAVLRGVLDFLCAYEPDLLCAAQALNIDPGILAAARDKL